LTINGDQDAMARYLVETQLYTNLVYDKSNEVYYRFVKHELQSVNPIQVEEIHMTIR
jgi:hypothetical protein